jgi:hypothetical protein
MTVALGDGLTDEAVTLLLVGPVGSAGDKALAPLSRATLAKTPKKIKTANMPVTPNHRGAGFVWMLFIFHLTYSLGRGYGQEWKSDPHW